MLSARHGYGSPPLLVLLGAIHLSQRGTAKFTPATGCEPPICLKYCKIRCHIFIHIGQGTGFPCSELRIPVPDYWSYNSPSFVREFIPFFLVDSVPYIVYSYCLSQLVHPLYILLYHPQMVDQALILSILHVSSSFPVVSSLKHHEILVTSLSEPWKHLL